LGFITFEDGPVRWGLAEANDLAGTKEEDDLMVLQTQKRRKEGLMKARARCHDLDTTCLQP